MNPYPEFTLPQDLPNYLNVDTLSTNMSYLYNHSYEIDEKTTSAKLNLKISFQLGNRFSGYIKAGTKLSQIKRTNDQGQKGYSGLQYGSGRTNPVFLYIDELYPEWGIKANVDEYQLLNVLPFLKDYIRSNFLDGEYPLGIIYDEDMMRKMSDALIAAPDSLDLWQPYSVGTFGHDYKGLEHYQAYYLMTELNWSSYLTFIPGVRFEGDYSEYDGQRYRVNQSGATVEQPPSEFVELFLLCLPGM